MLYALAIPLGFGANNQGEIQAAIYGIHWCINHGFKSIILEDYSQLLVNWINSNTKVPWSLYQFIYDLKEQLSKLRSYHCYHTYRETNNMVDLLSKRSHELDETQDFYIYQQLPTKIRGAYLIDKIVQINFRRRKLKRVKQPP